MRISPILTNHIEINLAKIQQTQTFNNNLNEFSLNYAEALKVYSLSGVSFTGKHISVYKIDKDLNCTYYDKQSTLTRELGVSPQSVSACLSGRQPTIDGFVIAYPDDIEVNSDNETRIIDKKKVAELYNKRINPRAVYSVDYDGSYIYLSSKSKINKQNTIFSISASDIESFDDNGRKIINRKKLSEMLIQHPRYAAVYSLDSKGIFVKYRNQADYAEKNAVTTTAVSNAVQKQNRKVNGDYIIPAKEIEIVLDDGEIAIDDKKVMDYLTKKYRPSESRRYTVTENMQVTRYETSQELADAIGINYATLIHTPDRLTPVGDYIIPASEVEEVGENGQFVVNQKKLHRAVWERSLKDAVYLVDMDCHLERFKDIKVAAKKLDRAEQTLYSVLYQDGVHKSVADRLVIKAADIETMDEQGNIIIDRKKVATLVQKNLCPRAVYLIAKDGQCKKYKNRFVLAKELGYPHSKDNLRINGFTVVDAKNIEEINDDGSISLNPEKLTFYASRSKNIF